MHKLTFILATGLVAMFATEAHAQHWTSREDVAVAAHRAADQLYQLDRLVDYRRVDRRFARDVTQLARMTERFHRSVERGARAPVLERRFDRLQRQFYDVRSQVRYNARGDRRLLRNWRQAARAFDQLEVVMGRFDGRDRIYRDRRHYDRPDIYYVPRSRPQRDATFRWYWSWP